MSEIELFSYEACPYAQRTRMALIEKGTPCRLTEIDLANRPTWFKDVSPYGKVPVLRHGKAVIYESRVINEYLDEVLPEPPLMPREPAARAQARIWMDYCDSYFVPAMHGLIGAQRDPEKQNKARETLRERLLFIEQEGLRKLSDGPYWLGANVSLIDLQFMPFFERFPGYAELLGAAIPAECTRLRDWMAAMETRASYRQTANDREYHMTRLRRFAQAA